MALRSLAGKLRGFLRRADPPAFDLEKELAGFRNPVARDIVKTTIEESQLFREECQKRIRKNYRDSVLIAAGGVGFMAYQVSYILEDLEKLDQLKAEAKGKATGAHH